MSSELLAITAGAVLAYVLEIVPGVKHFWDGVPKDWKRLVLFSLCLLIAGLGVWSACKGYDLHMGASCPAGGITPQTIIDLIFAALLAVTASQIVYFVGGAAKVGWVPKQQQPPPRKR